LLLFRADVYKSMRKISAFPQADGRFVFHFDGENGQNESHGDPL
jgi:hypothetical protein